MVIALRLCFNGQGMPHLGLASGAQVGPAMETRVGTGGCRSPPIVRWAGCAPEHRGGMCLGGGLVCLCCMCIIFFIFGASRRSGIGPSHRSQEVPLLVLVP